jgi:hypothetical protein
MKALIKKAAAERASSKAERLGIPGTPRDWARWRVAAGLSQHAAVDVLRKAGAPVTRANLANVELGRNGPGTKWAPIFAEYVKAIRELATGKGQGARGKG